jgi:hypothetical protein
MIPTEIEALGDERRVLESLTRLERRWLAKSTCGWCGRSCLAETCNQSDCDIDEQRAVWLKSYKPRAAIARATPPTA